ncbi:sodium:proton antiporter [Pelagibius sp. Alg239-R121]|uniref:cation:proton antiporter n=1 Tax=Pelagibius sp. Alg239-R121 TaxID=2993448 RepID=UPI0024A72286|nr:sodium:proton antiporter [Pelagibius sp. Alg239-R121]
MNTTDLSPFEAAAALIVLAAVLGYLNYRFIKLPQTIGLTIIGAVASLALLGTDKLFPQIAVGAALHEFVKDLDFHSTLMNGMLSFLLFAGALHVDLTSLAKRKWTVLAMATIGVALSTAIIGFGFKGLSMALGFDVPIAWCLVFGALISPTDPVAVMGILKSARVPATLEAKVAGESLFNDGVGVVIFSILLASAISGESLSLIDAGQLFVQEAIGGALLGLVIGGLAFLAMRSIDEHNIEVLITLALVMGGYALAQRLHVAGPVVMAVAGLLIGNHGSRLAMSETTREHLNNFWALLDEILNSVLFLLIGLEIVAIAQDSGHLLLGVASILLVLAGRCVGVGVPMLIMSRIADFTRGAYPILVWGGLRGGISIALALSLPESPIRETILTATYVIVVFSVVIQGATVGKVAKHFVPQDK